MRIRSRILTVGLIPIVIAAAIAVAAIVLLQEANRARTGAAVAATVYRTLLTAVLARNDYVNAGPGGRGGAQTRFFGLTDNARERLRELDLLLPDETHAIQSVQSALSHYASDMGKLVDATAQTDDMIAAMGKRASTLIRLTDQARERQHASNADIIQSLAEGDTKLRAARTIMDQAFAARLAVAALATDLLDLQGSVSGGTEAAVRRTLVFDANRLRRAAADLRDGIALDKDDPAPPSDDLDLGTTIDMLTAASTAAPLSIEPHQRDVLKIYGLRAEQLIKIYSAKYRALHEEAAQLLTYSVQAQETELSTQNVAIETLKLGNQSTEALARRDTRTAEAILQRSRVFTDTIAALPIAPLIQSEMADALAKWREGLQTTTAGLKQQNELMSEMDEASDAMVSAAGALDERFRTNAEHTAQSIQVILIIGAASGLLVGATAAFFVARSITRPLAHLQSRIMAMARNHEVGHIDGDKRRDELGDIARAANFFLEEIICREKALRRAAERADSALATLRQTQNELVQAEKLASLGQLVAGVAHEINTPVGIALTTSSVMEEEARRFTTAFRDGRISRAVLERLVERVNEGANLLAVNLGRAADLIQSFKHVAADQTSGERREFRITTFLHQLITSLGPMLRKNGDTVEVDCPDDLSFDGYPGALGQVVTNLVINASLHAYGDDKAGVIRIKVQALPDDRVWIAVADDGKGIAPEHQAKIFDPFYTTRRALGSSGLGLNIVFNIVTTQLGGRIWVESTLGKGTRFVVELPRVLAPELKSLPPREAVA